ncbi:P-loop containing nucleoside triphosphate hydrolase protein [Lineolata rhizophorae]|uniref:P-loop containing nucleoside triphosphate hydrolase protein n=1 Tax=Lineolata rhizophorae TaxID=578093 RepID=A0A6A6P5B1_9PEZI|nr:P-loop containing nucleoside triphosphate hydrolase protein [Lineolata rhizophorae]
MGSTMEPYAVEPEVPVVKILLLGDAGVGKSTFLSRLTLGHNAAETGTAGPGPPPPYELPRLRDLDQPFVFAVTLFARPYRFEMYDTASPTNYTLLAPDFLILCYDVTSRASLESLTTRWRRELETHFGAAVEARVPVMVLGLKRDLRRDWTDEERLALKGEHVMPQEGLGAAQKMRCDAYAECSAVTGELCREVLEDVTKMAAKTTTENGAKTPGTSCGVM